MMSPAPVSSSTSSAPRVRGLYAIAPELDDAERLAALVDAAIAGGARTIQYRNKGADAGLKAVQARRLAAVCATRRAAFVVNDDAELALAIPGAGLHVGRDDVDGREGLAALRASLGPSRLLGVSCYRSIGRAREAVAAGADYVAFGSVFPSQTKPQAPSATLGLFAEAARLGVATVAIGGIALANVAAVVAAGADAAAVIEGLFASRDPAVVGTVARGLADAFERVAVR